jgi:hypothetical protein
MEEKTSDCQMIIVESPVNIKIKKERLKMAEIRILQLDPKKKLTRSVFNQLDSNHTAVSPDTGEFYEDNTIVHGYVNADDTRFYILENNDGLFKISFMDVWDERELIINDGKKRIIAARVCLALREAINGDNPKLNASINLDGEGSTVGIDVFGGAKFSDKIIYNAVKYIWGRNYDLPRLRAYYDEIHRRYGYYKNDVRVKLEEEIDKLFSWSKNMENTVNDTFKYFYEAKQIYF